MSTLSLSLHRCRPHNRLNRKLRPVPLSLLRGLQLPLLLACFARFINYKTYLQTFQRPVAFATLLVLFLSTSNSVIYSASRHLPMKEVLLQKRHQQLVVRQCSTVNYEGYLSFATNTACPIILSKLFPAAISAFPPALQKLGPPRGLLVQRRRQKDSKIVQQGHQQKAAVAATNVAKRGQNKKKQIYERHTLLLDSRHCATSVYICQCAMQLRGRPTAEAALAGFLPPCLCSSFRHAKVEAAATNFAAAADCAATKSSFNFCSTNSSALPSRTVSKSVSSSRSGQITPACRIATVAAQTAGYCLANYIATDTASVASSLLLRNNRGYSSCKSLFSSNDTERGKQGEVRRTTVPKEVNSAVPVAGEITKSPARKAPNTSPAHMEGVNLKETDDKRQRTPRQLRLDRIQPHLNRRFQYHRCPASRKRVLRCFPPPPLKRRMLLHLHGAAASADKQAEVAETEKQQQKTQQQVPHVSAAETQTKQPSSDSISSHITSPEEDHFTPPPQPVSAFNWPPGCYLRIQYSGGRADDLDEAGRRIIAAVGAAGKDFMCSFPARLPTTRKRFSLAKSPFKHRTAIEQFQLVQRRRIIDVHVKKELLQAELRGERGERRWGCMPWPSRETRCDVAVETAFHPDDASAAASSAGVFATREAGKLHVATAAAAGAAAALGAISDCSSKLADGAVESVRIAAACTGSRKKDHLGGNEAANEEDDVFCAVTVPHQKKISENDDTSTEDTHNVLSSRKALQHIDYGNTSCNSNSSSTSDGYCIGSSAGGESADNSSLDVCSERSAVFQREADASCNRTSSCTPCSDGTFNNSAGVVLRGERAVTSLLAVVLPEQVQYTLRYEPYKLPQKAREIYSQLQYKKKWISKYFEYQQNMQKKEVLIAELLSEKYEYDRLVTWPGSFHDLRSYTASQIKKMLRIAENHYRERLSRRRRNIPVYRPRLKFFGDFRLPPEDEVVAGDPYARMPSSEAYKLEEKMKQGRLSSPQKPVKKPKREKTSKGKKRAKRG